MNIKTIKIYNTLPSNDADKYLIGFQRYRYIKSAHSKQNNGENKYLDAIYREYLEEIPFFKPICLKDTPYLQVNYHVTVLVNY